MEFRRLLLRVLLWSLGIGALLGAMAILAGGGAVAWRVASTAICTAVAAGLMMAGARISEQKNGWWAGLLMMGLVVVEFLGSMLLTWEVPLPATGRDEERVAATMFCLFICGTAAVILLRMIAAPAARVAVPSGLITSSAAFLLIMVSVWGSARPFSGQTYDWAKSGMAVGLIGLLLAGTLVNARPGSGSLPVLAVRGVGAAAAGTAMVVTLVGIWTHVSEDTGMFRIPLSIAGVVTLANLAWLVTLRPGQHWIRLATVAAGAATAIFFNIAASWPVDAELYARVGGAFGVVAAGGALALVVLARLNRRIGEPAAVLSAVTEVTLICPGCQTRQTLTVGGAACPSCRLRIHMRIEEPRCPACEYLIYMCKSDRCPECGALIPTDLMPQPQGSTAPLTPECPLH